jgi:hypothetical protein
LKNAFFSFFQKRRMATRRFKWRRVIVDIASQHITTQPSTLIRIKLKSY